MLWPLPRFPFGIEGSSQTVPSQERPRLKGAAMSTGQQGQFPGQLTAVGVGWGHKPGLSLGQLWD